MWGEQLQFSSEILQSFTTSFFSLKWLSLHVTYIEPIYCNIFVGDQNQQNTVESSRSTRSAREELPCAVSLGELIFLFAWQDSAIFSSMQYHK